MIIITNNSAIVYHILTKLGTKMLPYTTFLHTKFQGSQIFHFYFMVTSIPRQRKEEKKRREKKRAKKLSQILKVYISETPCMI